MSNLSNEVVLISGANRGIGRAFVEGALARGASKVYAAVRRLEEGQKLASELGAKVVPILFDLEKPESIVQAASQASDTTFVIHNAGVLEPSTALGPQAITSLEKQIEVNVTGLIRVAQAFAPVLKKNGGGKLVQLNSVVSIKNFASVATYSASKAAAYAITQSLREELLPQGTEVYSVHPGPIATDMAKQAGMHEMGVPPVVVADALYEAVEKKEFHVFPDPMAADFWKAYQSYAKAVVEPLPVQA
jgi:NAD(P)-dependent dehydrogenase (short-subunit alcohol dehydrogenase family)